MPLYYYWIEPGDPDHLPAYYFKEGVVEAEPDEIEQISIEVEAEHSLFRWTPLDEAKITVAQLRVAIGSGISMSHGSELNDDRPHEADRPYLLAYLRDTYDDPETVESELRELYERPSDEVDVSAQAAQLHQKRRRARLASKARVLLQAAVDRLYEQRFDVWLSKSKLHLLWRVGWRTGRDRLMLSVSIAENSGVETSLDWVGAAEVPTTGGSVIDGTGEDAELLALIQSAVEAMDREVLSDAWTDIFSERVSGAIGRSVDATTAEGRNEARDEILSETGDSAHARRLIDQAVEMRPIYGGSPAEKALVEMAVATTRDAPGAPRGFGEFVKRADEARRAGITGRPFGGDQLQEQSDDADDEATHRLAQRLVDIGFAGHDEADAEVD